MDVPNPCVRVDHHLEAVPKHHEEPLGRGTFFGTIADVGALLAPAHPGLGAGMLKNKYR